MKATNDSILIDGYLRLLDNLSPASKLDIISRLTNSVKSDLSVKQKSFYKAFGAWNSKKTSNQIISEIRSNRSFKRNSLSL